MRLSRDLLTRGITYKLQEWAYGGLSTATARKLEHANADPQSRGAAKPVQPISLRPGTRLVREWRGHQHGIETRNQAIGRSRGGLTTKIVAMVEALGNLVRLVLLPGQRHDSVGVEPLIEGIAFDALLGDKAFDNDWLRVELDRRGASALIPPKAGRARHISVSTCTNGVISSKTSSAILNSSVASPRARKNRRKLRSHDLSRGNPVRRNSNRLIEFVPPSVDDGLPVDGVDGGQDAIFELCTKNSRCT